MVGIENRSRLLIDQIKSKGFNPNLIVGIGRSGAILGGILAGNLGILPLAVVDHEYNWNKEKIRSTLPQIFVNEDLIKGKKILLVDAVSHTGETLKIVKNELMKFQPEELYTASLFKNEYCLEVPDFYSEEVKKVRKVPWRFMKEYREDFAPPK